MVREQLGDMANIIENVMHSHSLYAKNSSVQLTASNMSSWMTKKELETDLEKTGIQKNCWYVEAVYKKKSYESCNQGMHEF